MENENNKRKLSPTVVVFGVRRILLFERRLWRIQSLWFLCHLGGKLVVTYHLVILKSAYFQAILGKGGGKATTCKLFGGWMLLMNARGISSGSKRVSPPFLERWVFFIFWSVKFYEVFFSMNKRQGCHSLYHRIAKLHSSLNSIGDSVPSLLIMVKKKIKNQTDQKRTNSRIKSAAPIGHFLT